jgi:hypothetical protein
MHGKFQEKFRSKNPPPPRKPATTSKDRIKRLIGAPFQFVADVN